MQAADRDPQLWNIAKARAKFKSHLFTFVLVNLLLWGIWFVTGQRNNSGLPWPAYATIFWGIGLAIQGFATYSGMSAHSLSEREYQKLLRDKEAGR